MTDRIFLLAKSLMDTLKAMGNGADWSNNPVTIIVYGWDSLSALEKTTITTDMTTNNFQFDHDQ